MHEPIKQRRLALGLRQVDLAHLAGVTQASVSQIERDLYDGGHVRRHIVQALDAAERARSRIR